MPENDKYSHWESYGGPVMVSFNGISGSSSQQSSMIVQYDWMLDLKHKQSIFKGSINMFVFCENYAMF